MRKLATALFVAVIIAGTPFALLFGTKRQAPICVHSVGVARAVEGKALLVGFAISNAVDRTLIPKRLEHLTGTAWVGCPEAILSFTESKSSPFYCMLGTVPGGRLRMVFRSSRPTEGLKSFWLRLNARLSGNGARVSLNPFDKTLIFYSEPDVISDEFTAP